jgi:hypothetical protein
VAASVCGSPSDEIDREWLAPWIEHVKFYDQRNGNKKECWFDVTADDSHYFSHSPTGKQKKCVSFKISDTICDDKDTIVPIPNWMEINGPISQVRGDVGYGVYQVQGDVYQEKGLRGGRSKRGAPTPSSSRTRDMYGSPKNMEWAEDIFSAGQNGVHANKRNTYTETDDRHVNTRLQWG